jgi:hypothetical protein
MGTVSYTLANVVQDVSEQIAKVVQGVYRSQCLQGASEKPMCVVHGITEKQVWYTAHKRSQCGTGCIRKACVVQGVTEQQVWYS